jgi:hypothetical protein
MRLALIALLLAAPLAAQSPFAFREASPASLELTENGRPVFVYNHGMILKPGVDEKYRRSSYVHPVYAPDGTVLTDDFPADHPHHRGICWTWPEVKFEGQTHDVWAVIGMHQRFVRWIKRETHADRAVLAVENGWFVGEKQAVRELVEITAFPAAGAAWNSGSPSKPSARRSESRAAKRKATAASACASPRARTPCCAPKPASRPKTATWFRIRGPNSKRSSPAAARVFASRTIPPTPAPDPWAGACATTATWRRTTPGSPPSR